MLQEFYEIDFCEKVSADLVSHNNGLSWFSVGVNNDSGRKKSSVAALTTCLRSCPSPDTHTRPVTSAATTVSTIGLALAHNEMLVEKCRVDLLDTVKEAFAAMGSAFAAIRGKINPYECLGKGPGRLFINRSAMKIVNLDSMFCLLAQAGWRRQVQVQVQGDQQGVEEEEVRMFTFLDICGGPGGFTEYFAMRCCALDLPATGFGMTLRYEDTANSCNWNLDHLNQYPHCVVSKNLDINESCSIAIHIVSGDGSGDIYNRNNLEVLHNSITTVLGSPSCTHITRTSGEGDSIGITTRLAADAYPSCTTTTTAATDESTVDTATAVAFVDVVTADGGADFDRYNTEELAVPLLMCEVITMIHNLRTGGTFVLKLFSIHKMCTFDVFFLLSELFDRIMLVKPVSSRPATGEMYVVCEGLRHDLSEFDRVTLADSMWDRVHTLKTGNEGSGGSRNEDDRHTPGRFNSVFVNMPTVQRVKNYILEYFVEDTDPVVSSPYTQAPGCADMHHIMSELKLSLTIVSPHNMLAGSNLPSSPPKKKIRTSEQWTSCWHHEIVSEPSVSGKCDDEHLWRRQYERYHPSDGIKASDYYDYWRLYDLVDIF